MTPSPQNNQKLEVCSDAVAAVRANLHYLADSDIPRKECAAGSHGWDPSTLDGWATQLEKFAAFLRAQATLLDA